LAYTAPNLAAQQTPPISFHPGRLLRLERGDFSGCTPQRTVMANTPSAKKATRKIEARTAVNKSRRSRVRTFIRKVEEAIVAGDHKVAMEALAVAAPEINRAASKGIVHANLAARKVSRLNSRVKALSA
jgi:small subunit ribosomal protein S20